MPHKYRQGFRQTVIIICALLSPGAIAALPLADGNGQPLPTLAPVLEKARPAVVNIATKGFVQQRENPLLSDPFFRFFFDLPDRRPRPQQRQEQSLGSGVIIDAAKGYIITNNHVIDKADEITVTLVDGRSLSAKLVGADPEADVAVIQVPSENLVALPMADSDSLRVGDFVVAIGNPFGLGQTVTSGIVSALGRTGLGIEGYEDFIQTDASINPGNSGGALINLRGELVGINTAILAPGGGNVGIGFAIPVNMASDIMAQLVTHGEVKRGQLGVIIQDLTPELASAFGIDLHRGAVIAEVLNGSPADKAGIKVGDVIIEVGGRKINSASDLRNRLGLLRVGQKVELKVLRDGKTRTLQAKIGSPQMDSVAGGAMYQRLDGATIGEINPSSPLYGKVEGVIVSDVKSNSAAWRAGLRKGDLIVSVNRRKVTSIKEFEAIAQASRKGLLLNIQRGNSAMFILVK